MNPILFRYGGFALHYSQVIFLAAFGLTYQLSHHRAKKLGITTADWERALTYYVLGAVLSARLGYVLSNLPLFFGRWREALTFWHGAFTVWGAILGLVLAALVLKKRGQAGIPGLDILALVFPLFLGLAEWGRFTEGEGWGRMGQGLLTWEHSGAARYPVWFFFSLWYLLTALVLAGRKARWAGEHFLIMVASMALAALVLTPLSILPGAEALMQYAWGILFLGVAAIMWLKLR